MNERRPKTETTCMHTYRIVSKHFRHWSIFPVELLSSTELYHWQAFCSAWHLGNSAEALRPGNPLRASAWMWPAASGSQWGRPWGDLWFGMRFGDQCGLKAISRFWAPPMENPEFQVNSWGGWRLLCRYQGSNPSFLSCSSFPHFLSPFFSLPPPSSSMLIQISKLR